MNQYVKNILEKRIAEIDIYIAACDKEIKKHHKDLNNINKQDLMYPTLLDVLGQEYIEKGNLVAEKINLENELNKKS